METVLDRGWGLDMVLTVHYLLGDLIWPLPLLQASVSSSALEELPCDDGRSGEAAEGECGASSSKSLLFLLWKI